MGVPRFYGDQIATDGVANLSVGVTAGKIPSTGIVNAHVKAAAGIVGSKLADEAQMRFLVGPSFDIDNGAGTTIDVVLLRPSVAITLTAARIVYEDATTGTVAAGNVKLGTTVGGNDLVAATAYENSKAVGTTTAMVLASAAVAAATPICCRHTGIAATAAGKAHVELEFTIDDA